MAVRCLEKENITGEGGREEEETREASRSTNSTREGIMVVLQLSVFHCWGTEYRRKRHGG